MPFWVQARPADAGLANLVRTALLATMRATMSRSPHYLPLGPSLCAVIPSQVWQRVLRFSGERGRAGTGTLGVVDGQRVLITAKHLCLDDREEQVVLRHPWSRGGEAVSEVLERIGPLDAPADVAVFRLPETLVEPVTGEVALSSEGFYFTQDCYILGYPYGLAHAVGDQGEQQLPFVKRGIVAGAAGQDPREITLDVIANPGFSGGPAVVLIPGISRWQVIGIVKGTLTGPLVEPTTEEPHPPRVSAGLSSVTDITAALRLVEAG